MGKVVQSTYSIDFTDASLGNVSEEIRVHQELRKEITKRLNKKFEIIMKHRNTLPLELRGALLGQLSEDINDLDHEGVSTGRAQMYEFIGHDIPRLLPRILLRLFKVLKIPMSKKRIDEAHDWAILQILEQGLLGEGKQRAQIAKEYGMDKAFWTRASSTPIANAFKEFIKKLSDSRKTEEHPFYVRTSTGSTTSGRERGPFERTKTEFGIRLEKLKDYTQDWAVAKKLALLEGMPKAVEFLEKQRFSRQSIQKFKKEASSRK